MKSIISKILRATDFIFKPKTAYAHCDIPCGVYEPDSAKWAAETVHALTEKLLALEMPAGLDKKAVMNYTNTASRMVKVKEKFAEICKKELLILWTDYFRPEHFQKHPDLTEKIHKATKQCSIVKREVNLEAAQKLKDMVDEIAKIFLETKK